MNEIVIRIYAPFCQLAKIQEPETIVFSNGKEEITTGDDNLFSEDRWAIRAEIKKKGCMQSPCRF
jgi:hypothetical protein